MKMMLCGSILYLLSITASADSLPLGLPPVPIPPDNPQSAEKIALGKRLFHDARLSANGTISCASCHDPTLAFTDGLVLAKGIKAQIGYRNSPTVANAAFYTELFVDGRVNSLEAQALGPLMNPIEHGLPDQETAVARVRRDAGYVQAFQRVFEVEEDNITMEHVVKAIASYERTLIFGNSPFDRYFFQADQTAISQSAKRGARVFRRKGNCANCHEISFGNALFTDNRFYNIGVGFQRLTPVLDQYLQALETSTNAESLVNAEQQSELGRFAVTGVKTDIGKFKVPTLRNIALTAPYMHDGSQQTLKQVVDYYDKGGDKNPYLDPAIFPLHLTPQEKTDMVAFMQTLTSPEFTEDVQAARP